MPGLDFYKTPEPSVPAVVAVVPETPIEEDKSVVDVPTPSPEAPLKPGVYYNPRLDPKNFLEGPLSWDAATRLRQMLARPGIVVRTDVFSHANNILSHFRHRLPLEFAMASVPVVHLRQALIACTKVELPLRLPALVSQTLLLQL